MLSLFAIVTTAGVLMGLWRLRAGALLAASVAVFVCAVFVQALEPSLLAAIGFTYALLSSLQSGYLAGLYAADETTT